MPIRSLPISAIGQHWAYIGVGWLKPSEENISKKIWQNYLKEFMRKRDFGKFWELCEILLDFAKNFE
jgi:hypothetical protein